MERRVIPRKRKRLIVRSILQLILPVGIGGFVLVLSITLNVNQAFSFFLFCSFIVFLFVFFDNINRIVFVNNFKRLPFVALQIVKFITEVICISTIIGYYFYYKYHYNIISKEHYNLLVIALLCSFTIGYITSVSVLFNRLMGFGVLFKYLSGKYHTPTEEERIFMFIDLQGSTTIAEQIGHKQFFSLINELLFEIANSVIENDGEIYKYVGDEIIISWTPKKGINNNNCINLFYDIESQIINHQSKYVNTYGVIPKFKAGVHIGKVIVGEMGDHRTEIAYMGDVVNTTARIQSECNALNANLLISKDLLNRLTDDYSYHYEELNKLRLKGKLTDTILVKVTRIVD